MPDIDMHDLLRQVAETERADLEAYERGVGEAPIVYRQVSGAVKNAESEGAIEFTLSHESEDRMGDVVRADGWDLTSFQANPVMLWAHNSTDPPIGKWSNVRVQEKELVGAGVFDDDQFSRLIENKVRRGFLNAVSVGFRPTEFKARESDNPFGGLEFTKQELLETSVVPIPAHPRALRKALEMLEEKRWFFMPAGNGVFVAEPVEDMAKSYSFTVSDTPVEEPVVEEVVEPEPEIVEEKSELQELAERVEALEKLVLSDAATDEQVVSEDEAVDENTDAEESPESDVIEDESRAYRDDIERFMKSLTGELSHE